MIRAVLATLTLSALSAVIYAEGDEHLRHGKAEPVSANDPSIKITINPEARVSVTLGGAKSLS